MLLRAPGIVHAGSLLQFTGTHYWDNEPLLMLLVMHCFSDYPKFSKEGEFFGFIQFGDQMSNSSIVPTFAWFIGLIHFNSNCIEIAWDYSIEIWKCDMRYCKCRIHLLSCILFGHWLTSRSLVCCLCCLIWSVCHIVQLRLIISIPFNVSHQWFTQTEMWKLYCSLLRIYFTDVTQWKVFLPRNTGDCDENTHLEIEIEITLRFLTKVNSRVKHVRAFTRNTDMEKVYVSKMPWNK